jgi:hypothetical protein
VEKSLPKSVALCLKGIKHRDSMGDTPQKITAPLTFRILKKIKKILRIQKWKESSKQVIFAACCIGYFGAFRAVELLAKTEQRFDKFSDLLWSDIKFLKDGAQVLIKLPKTGTPGGETVDLFRFPNADLCPVATLSALRSWQQKAKIFSDQMPVFRFGSGKNLTVSGLSRILRTLLRRTRFRNLNISAKSIRSGLPTDMECHPDLMHDGHVKNKGRWRSRSYQLYMKGGRVQKQWIFEKICKALE